MKMKKRGKFSKKIKSFREGKIKTKNLLKKIPKIKIAKKIPNLKKVKFSFLEKLKDEKIKFKKKKLRSKQLPKKIVKPGLFTTDLDRLVDFVDKYKVVKLSEAAVKFNISKDKVEKWGNILEQHNLLKLYYPAFGEPKLMKLDVEEEQGKIEVTNIKRRLIINLTIIILVFSITTGLIIFKSPRFNTPSGMVTADLDEDVIMAFSGFGNYICEYQNMNATLYIKNKKMRIEMPNNVQSITIIKDGFVFTYDSRNGKWSKENAEGIVIPGGGKYPEQKMKCRRTKELEDNKFEVEI